MNKNAPFNYKTCLSALLYTTREIQTQFYDFCLFLTFKKSLKHYGYNLRELDEEILVQDTDFFATVEDPFVVRSYQSMIVCITLADDIELRHGITTFECLNSTEIEEASSRYSPTIQDHLITKSYAQLLFYFITFYDSILLSLYYYACALSLKSYDIPIRMRTRLDYSFEGSYKHLDLKNADVVMILETMEGFIKEQLNIKDLVEELKPNISCPKV
ncbi:hypothetical protein [Pedobacter frigidisoli]|uniref:hypothetical protein n=1 Tax=Pedobacter frigidisoli TaxID=2530455 RepID=UPI00292DAACC|nr:hypothetical protein [Pedobacter frigidisoli]